MANLDLSLNVAGATGEFFRHFSRSSWDTCGHSIYELLHPSAQNILPPHFMRLADGSQARFVERVVALRGSDRLFSVQLTGIATHDEHDRLSGVTLLISSDEENSQEANVAFQTKPLLSVLDARILEGIATGASTLQLASRLYLSRQGVEYHVGQMLRQFKAANRAALVSRAYSMGILTMGTWPPQALAEFIK